MISRSETVGKKIQRAELKKVPFMLIIGEKEVNSEVFSCKSSWRKDLGKMRIIDFIKFILDKTKETIKIFNNLNIQL